MGEYAKRGSRQIKLGTCEDLMYVTRADIEALAASGWRGDNPDGDLRDYLTCKVSRFALPRSYDVPGDPDVIDKRKPDFEHSYRIGVDARTVNLLREADHNPIYFHKAGHGFAIPCPCGKDWIEAFGKAPAYPYIELIAEGAHNGRAVFRCPYCGEKFNVMGHAAQAIILQAFRDRWMVGDSRLRDTDAAYLIRMIEVGMESVPV